MKSLTKLDRELKEFTSTLQNITEHIDVNKDDVYLIEIDKYTFITSYTIHCKSTKGVEYKIFVSLKTVK